MKLTFKLDDFEGPLDLLLHLIAKHKMDIYDIEIAELIRQYLTYIEAQKKNNLDLATEFLEMASRLVYIKSSMLLPKYEEIDELTQELQGQLIEYKLIKKIAEKLQSEYVGDQIFFREPVDIKIDLTYTKIHQSIELKKAFLDVIVKSKRRLPPDRKDFHAIVERPIISIKSRITMILENLYEKGEGDFMTFFESCENNSEKVATFLAMLELIKSNKVKISSDNTILYSNNKLKTSKEQS